MICRRYRVEPGNIVGLNLLCVGFVAAVMGDVNAIGVFLSQG
jgi:hypothetical protein